MHEKGHKLKNSPSVKNLQFSSSLANIQAKSPTHEAIILTKFHKECKKIVNFLHTQKFLDCALFYASPFNSPQSLSGSIHTGLLTQKSRPLRECNVALGSRTKYTIFKS